MFRARRIAVSSGGGGYDGRLYDVTLMCVQLNAGGTRTLRITDITDPETLQAPNGR